jgi:hypothetical protein
MDPAGTQGRATEVVALWLTVLMLLGVYPLTTLGEMAQGGSEVWAALGGLCSGAQARD